MMSDQWKQKLLKAGSIGIGCLLIGLLGLFFWNYGPEIWAIFTGGNVEADLEAFVRSLGPMGIVAIVIFQFFQIVVAFLPGEPIELASGLLYGGFLGAILCLAGSLVGTAAVYWAVKKLGHNFIAAFQDEKKVHRFKAFQYAKNAEVLAFILYLIPGIPKDFISFVAPLTPMKPGRFLLISILGRAPGMFITTYAGMSLANGNWKLAVVLYGILTLGAVAGCIYYRRISAREQ